MLTIVAFSLCICTATATSDADRIATMESASAAKPSAMLNFNIGTFQKYIEAPSRSYGVFVFFTADPAQCKPCAMMQPVVIRAAREYRALRPGRKTRRRVFFAVLQLSERDGEFLRRYGMERVPLLHYFGPRARPGPLAGPDLFRWSSQGVGLNDLRRFVNERTGSRMQIPEEGEVPFVATVKQYRSVLLSTAVLGTPIVLRTRAHKLPMFWFACVMIVYIFSIGGAHYSWRHNMPLYVVDRDGTRQFMLNEARSQYAAEGFFISAMCVIISVFIVLIQELPRFVGSRASQTFGGVLLATMTFVAVYVLLTLYQHVRLFAFLLANAFSVCIANSPCFPSFLTSFSFVPMRSENARLSFYHEI